MQQTGCGVRWVDSLAIPPAAIRRNPLVAKAAAELGQSPCVAVVGSGMHHSCAFPSVPMLRSRLVLCVDLRQASNDKRA